MSPRTAAIVLVSSLTALVAAGCDRSAPEPADTRPQPILPASVSDAMLDMSQRRTEAPMLAPEVDAGGEPAGGGDPAAAGPRNPGRTRPTSAPETPESAAPDAAPSPPAPPAASPAAAEAP